MMEFVFDLVENIVRKLGENAGYHHFLSFPQCFPWDSVDKGYSMEWDFVCDTW